MRIGTIIGLGVGVLAVAGYVYYKRQANKLSNIKVKPVKYRFSKLSFNDASLNVDLEVFNESNIDVTIKSYDIDAFVNSTKVVKLKNDVNQVVKANGSSLITVNFSFNPTSVLKGLFQADIIKGLVFDRSKVVIGLAGYVSVSGSGILDIDNIPVNYSSPLSTMVSG